MNNIVSMSTNNQWNGREGYRPLYIVMHATAGGASAAGIANYFISTEGSNNPVSSNFIIGQDGEVVSLVPEENAAYANGPLEPGHDYWWTDAINPNLLTISIEMCNTSTTNADLLTSAQKTSLFPLVKGICQRWKIPMRKANGQGGITGHFSLLPIDRRDCPGENFPWQEFMNYLQKGTEKMSTVPAGWHDEAGVLYRPDRKFKVVHGFRDHILADSNWQSSNWPIEDEQGVTQLEESNPGLGGGTRQAFHLGQLEWNKTRGAFDGWVGNELIALRTQVASLKTENALLQTKISK